MSFSRALSAMLFTSRCHCGTPRSTKPKRWLMALSSRTRARSKVWSSAWWKNRSPSSMLITLSSGEIPNSKANRLKSRSQTLWTVPMSDSAVRSAKSAWPLARNRSRTRSRSSEAALTVKVVPMMPAGAASPANSARSNSSVRR